MKTVIQLTTAAGLLAGVLFTMAPPDSALAQGEKEAQWAAVKARQGLTLAPEWLPPVALGPPLSTLGWEDSLSVSPDGNTLTFTYFRLDPIMLAVTNTGLRVDGPPRPNWPQEEPFNSYGAEIYLAKKVAGVWQEPVNLGAPVNVPESTEGDQWLSADGLRLYYNSGEGSRKRGIYYSERANLTAQWSAPVYLNDHINSGAEDENPYLSKDEKSLYFESARAGGSGGKDLYVSEKIDGVWQKAKNMGPVINSSGNDIQPYLSTDGTTFLFSRNETIFRSRKRQDGTWDTPQVIVSGGAVGEPTMTDSGDLYFIQVFTKDGEYDADIMMAKKK